MSPVVAPDPPLVDEVLGIALRPWREGDAAALSSAWQDPEIARWCAVPEDTGEAAAARWIAGWSDRVAGCTALDLVVADTNDDGVVGEVGIRRLRQPAESGSGAYELGWWLIADVRGWGLATVAVDMVATWLAGLDPTTPIVARIPAGHLASEGVAGGSGFRRRGRLDDGRILWVFER